jgi:selenocysteine lyase/cysteine desulfurase
MANLQSDLDEATLAVIRREFPGTERLAYFDVAGRGLLPLRTRRRLDAYLDSRMYDGGDKPAMFEMAESARRRFATLIGAEPDEIALTKNISEGLNIIATAFPWTPGDNVVVCADREHPNNIYPWLHLARRIGIEVRQVPSRDGLIPTEEMIAAIDRRTRILTASSVSFFPGFRTDLDAIGAACRERNVLFLVDAAQSAGVLTLDLGRTPVDAVAVSTQKGLLGLYGMGFLYCRKEWCERLIPTYLARFGVDLGDAHEADIGSLDYTLMPGARRFDLGNYNFAAAAAVDSSLELLAEIGPDVIERHAVSLARVLAERLAELGLPVAGIPFGSHFGSIVTIAEHAELKGDLSQLYDRLQSAGVKLSIRRGGLRFSTHIYNTLTDVDRVSEIVRAWANETSSHAQPANASLPSVA